MLRNLMTSWNLNTSKVTVWLFQERKELSKWNRKHFSSFHKCSLLEIQNTLTKMLWTRDVKGLIPFNTLLTSLYSSKCSNPMWTKQMCHNLVIWNEFIFSRITFCHLIVTPCPSRGVSPFQVSTVERFAKGIIHLVCTLKFRKTRFVTPWYAHVRVSIRG